MYNISDEEFNEIIKARKEYVFKFNQLKPEMIYLIEDGYDNFKNIIKSINYFDKTFTFIDLSFPDFDRRFMLEQTSKKYPYIPDVYENEEMFEKRILFKFIELDENQLMQLFNTTDFEQKLYYKYYIKSLLKIISVQKAIIKKLQILFDNKIYENLDSIKIRNLKNYINKLHEKHNIPKLIEPIELIKTEYSNKTETTDKEKIKKQSDIIRNLNAKIIKYREIMFEKIINN